ncbi:MAG: hypothetical protein RSF67_08930 [Clostridia bacterium]
MNIENLIKEVSQITASGLPFMEGKEKLEIEGNILNNVLTVDNFGFLVGVNEETKAEEEYVVISLKEYPKHFIYGSSVVTQAFKQIDSRFTEEEVGALIQMGLTFELSKKVSKQKNRKYTKIVFFPNK